MYKTVNSSSGSVILRNRPLKFPIPIVLDMTGYRNCITFYGKMFENQSEIGHDRKHKLRYGKKKTQKLTNKLFYTPMSTSVDHISK